MTKQTKRAITCMLCLTPLFFVPQTQFANDKVVEAAKEPQLPVQVDADSLYYIGRDGDFTAKGNVILKQGTKELKTELVEGNINAEEYRAPGEVKLKDSNMDVKASNLKYNGGKYVNMSGEDIFGRINNYYVKGEKFEFKDNDTNGKGIVKNASLTTENAMAWTKSPDYRVDGESVEIVPKEELVINNAKFYINDWHFMTLKKYKTSLVPNPYGQKTSLFDFIPKPSYRSKNGFGLRSELVYPFGPNLFAFFKYGWYSKVGFKPALGITYADKVGVATLAYRKEESSVNEDHIWLTKEPELEYRLKKLQIAKTPFYFDLKANIGYWKEDSIKGFHYLYDAALSHEPIKLGRKSDLNFQVAYQKDYYGYNKVERDMPYWNVRLNHRCSPKLSLYTAYYENHNNGDTPYYFDRYEFNKHLDFGFNYKIDRLNTIGVYWKEDTMDHHLAYQNIVYYRDLHSMSAKITYKTKQKELQYKLIFKDF